jgi:hypothetical protein
MPTNSHMSVKLMSIEKLTKAAAMPVSKSNSSE